MDKSVVKNGDLVKVMTFKSGKFVFSHRFDAAKLMPYLLQANILHATVKDLPILPDLAARLEEEIIRRSIFGTAAIEGNPLKEEEVAKIISEPDKRESLEGADKEIRNLKTAYDYLAEIKISAESAFMLEEDQIRHVHSMITRDIIHEQNAPGQYRNHRVKVGDSSHGGVYTPPHIHEDIQNLTREFILWINSPEVTTLDPIIRAALAHYHFGLIHPFGDGNGRTARLIEAMLIKSSGFTFVPVMLSNYYYKHVDDYFWAFSITRKNKEHDVTHFLEFVLKRVAESLTEIKDRIIYFIRKFTLREYYMFLRKEMRLNRRRHDLLMILLDESGPFSFDDLFTISSFRVLYKTVSQRTAKRDLKALCDQKLLNCKKDEYSLNLRVLG
jgi:Fic family protein